MSVSATNLASSVAAAPASSQQTARARERSGSTTAELRQLRDRIEVHFQALEEGDESDSPAQLRVDSQVPEHQNPHQDQSRRQRRRGPYGQVAASSETPAASSAPTPVISSLGPLPGRDKPMQLRDAHPSLYQHLDVKA